MNAAPINIKLICYISEINLKKIKTNNTKIPILKSNSLLTSTALLILLFGSPKLAIALCTDCLVISDSIALKQLLIIYK